MGDITKKQALKSKFIQVILFIDGKDRICHCTPFSGGVPRHVAVYTDDAGHNRITQVESWKVREAIERQYAD